MADGALASQMIRALVERNLATGQNRLDGDYVGEDGLLRCGRCNERKEKLITIRLDGENVERKVVCICLCEQEKIKAEREEKKRKDEEDRLRRMRIASLMDERFFNARFEKSEITMYNKKNIGLCKRYASSFQTMVENNQGLLFYGDIGTGKSYAAACIANELIDAGVPVIMTSFVKILGLIQNHEQEDDALNKLTTAKLVIFDDLGAERSTDYALEKIYNVVDSRYRASLPMILTTNVTLEEMFRETDIRYKRIYDRIFEVCYPVQWTGPSWRKKQAKEKFEKMKELLGDE